MQARPDLVCIVLVNWNGWQDTAECLRSCRALDYPATATIVVDNGSTDGSVARLREEFGSDGSVTILEAGGNLGFAGGNNLGIERALARGAGYVWLLNNDTTVEPETLTALVRALEEQPDAGIAGSKVYFADRPDTLWFAGGFISRRWGRTYHRGEGEPDRGQYDAPGEIDYATGASLLVRTDVVERIGPMDESYFLYWEETDWCERARAAGWRVVYAPASRVWHKVGASTPSRESHVKWRYEGRNRILFHRRHRPRETARVAFLSFVNAAYLLLRGRAGDATQLARGVIDGLSGRSTGPLAP